MDGTVTLSQTLGYSNSIKQNIVDIGGSIDGDLRLSIQWNDKDNNPNDFDAHCIEPEYYEIFYGNKDYVSPSGGTLDVDIVNPQDSVAVENIIYKDRHDMAEGTYDFFVYCFSNNGGTSGFSAEIEIQGRIYNFEYNENLVQGEIVQVAEVKLNNGRFTLIRKLGQ